MRTWLALAVVLAAAQAAPPDARRPGPAHRVIAGRVITPEGHPAAATVTLIERIERNGAASFHIVDPHLDVPTDSEGRYRIPDARLGEFYVVAMPRNSALGRDGRPSRSGYRMTFYPSAPSAETAKAVTVTVREPVAADITLLAAPLAVVRGTVYDSKAVPPPGGRLLIAHGDHLFGVGGAAASLRPDGTFAIAGMPPGTYFLQYREGPWPPPRGETPRVSGARVVIDGQDVIGVRVAPIHMVPGSGRVIVPEALRAEVPRGRVTVDGAPIDVEGNPGPARPGVLRDDLTFTFAAWPGRVRLVVAGMPYAWRIKAVRYRGEEVTAAGIDFTGPGAVSGIEIELERGVR